MNNVEKWSTQQLAQNLQNLEIFQQWSKKKTNFNLVNIGKIVDFVERW